MKNIAQGILSILFLTFIISAVVVLVLGTISWLFDMRFVTKSNGSELVNGDMAFNLIATVFLLFCASVTWALMEYKKVWNLIKTYPLISMILIGTITAVAIPVKRISEVYGNGGPLPNAVTTRNHEEVKRLLTVADFEQAVLDRQLQRALNEGYFEIASTMIENGADIFWTNEFGSTRLHYAVSFGSPEAVQYLLDHGLNPNQANNSGSTPLTDLISSRSLYVNLPEDQLEAQICKIADLLLAAGADPAIGVRLGSSPLEAAQRNGYNQVAAKLE